jgi:hypothetical protein
MRIAASLLALAFAVPVIAAPEPAKSTAIDDSAKIAEKLLERMSIDEQLDKVAFRDAIKFLQDRTGLTILIDMKAIRDKNQEMAQAIEDAAISLPAMKNVRIETVLRKIVDQLDAEYVIAPDHVSITTPAMKDLLTGQARRLPDLYPAPGTDETDADRPSVVRTTPYMTFSFKETSVADALKEVAARAGRNVIISQSATEKAKNSVSVSLSNVAFETAAATLAETAGLRAFRTGNVVVIVTPERAKQIEEVSAKAAVIGFGGLGGPAIGLSSDANATDARIKELEEKIRKLTEEMEKSRKKD